MVTEKCRDFSSRDFGYFRTASYARSLKCARVSISSALMHTACTVACDRTCALPTKKSRSFVKLSRFFCASVNRRIKMSRLKIAKLARQMRLMWMLACSWQKDVNPISTVNKFAGYDYLKTKTLLGIKFQQIKQINQTELNWNDKLVIYLK